MIRISTLQEADCTVVIIDGELSADDLPAVRQVRASLSGPLTLQLRGLTYCAEDGILELQDWLATGARLRDADLFLRMLLDENKSGIRPLLADLHARR